MCCVDPPAYSEKKMLNFYRDTICNDILMVGLNDPCFFIIGNVACLQMYTFRLSYV